MSTPCCTTAPSAPPHSPRRSWRRFIGRWDSSSLDQVPLRRPAGGGGGGAAAWWEGGGGAHQEVVGGWGGRSTETMHVRRTKTTSPPRAARGSLPLPRCAGGE